MNRCPSPLPPGRARGEHQEAQRARGQGANRCPPPSPQAVLEENTKKRGELEGKLNHEREKHQAYDRDAKDLEKKFQVADKEHQVRGGRGGHQVLYNWNMKGDGGGGGRGGMDEARSRRLCL